MTLTAGIDHIGLTVSNLEASLTFFTKCLGWTKFGGNDAYPAAYITDGTSKITLWQAKADIPSPFDRHVNIGLHHLALKIRTREELDNVFGKVSAWPDVHVEFGPEFSGNGPKVHCMIYEPGGNRIEFSYDPR